jgi:hypothetical protein
MKSIIRRARACVICSLVILGAGRSACAQVAAGEYQIKAAFVRSFTKFVEWPATSLPPNGSPLCLGIVGDDPFGDTIVDALRGATASGHPIELHHLLWNEPRLSTCHVLFISSSEVQHLSQILTEIDGASVLTVGDFDSFSRRGGAIELKMIAGRVRFDINLAAATRAGLHISSKLLSIANSVIQAQGGRS